MVGKALESVRHEDSISATVFAEHLWTGNGGELRNGLSGLTPTVIRYVAGASDSLSSAILGTLTTAPQQASECEHSNSDSIVQPRFHSWLASYAHDSLMDRQLRVQEASRFA